MTREPIKIEGFSEFNTEAADFWKEVLRSRRLSHADIQEIAGGGEASRFINGKTRIELDNVENLLRSEELNFTAEEASRFVRLYLRAHGVSEEGLLHFTRALINPMGARAATKVPDFWKPLLTHALHVIAPRHPKKLGEIGGTLSWTDYQAVEELQGFAAQHGIFHLPVSHSDLTGGISYANSLRDAKVSTNLILIGGPVVNYIAKRAMEILSPTFQFVERTGKDKRGKPWLAIHNTLTGEDLPLPPVITRKSKEISHDFAIIVRAFNPFESSKEMLYIAGYHGYGTWGATRALVHDEAFQHQLKNRLDASETGYFECVVRTEVGDFEPTRTVIEHFKHLKVSRPPTTHPTRR